MILNTVPEQKSMRYQHFGNSFTTVNQLLLPAIQREMSVCVCVCGYGVYHIERNNQHIRHCPLTANNSHEIIRPHNFKLSHIFEWSIFYPWTCIPWTKHIAYQQQAQTQFSALCNFVPNQRSGNEKKKIERKIRSRWNRWDRGSGCKTKTKTNIVNIVRFSVN